MSQESTDHKIQPPGSDLWQAIAWVCLGVATLVGAWRMDRLEGQGINPYTVPGLLPALLGVSIVMLGFLLLYRSLQRKKDLLAGEGPTLEVPPTASARTWTVLGLCLSFAVFLVGRRLPFWAASAIFITVAIYVLTPRTDPSMSLQKLLLKALVIGVVAGILISVVFQELFLVRLP